MRWLRTRLRRRALLSAVLRCSWRTKFQNPAPSTMQWCPTSSASAPSAAVGMHAVCGRTAILRLASERDLHMAAGLPQVLKGGDDLAAERRVALRLAQRAAKDLRGLKQD